MPTAGSAAPTAAASETLEFSGVSSIGKRTDLIFHDKAAKKSHWVGIGETKEGISVVSYDTRREQAVIKLNGVEKILTLRKVSGPKGTGAPGAPGVPAGPALPPTAPNQPAPATLVFAPPAPPPTAPAAGTDASGATPAAPPPTPGPPPTVLQKQETEARMLVSDLLEIGMAQRKAYEEAQRKAADGTAPPTPPTPEAPKQP